MPSIKVQKCANALADKEYKIFFVESATGGRMCSEFSLTPNSGDFLRGGISCYEVFIKEKILNVPHSLIKKFTPESAEVTQALAENSYKLFKSDVVVATTGLTTSGGSETREKPVGTMFIHIIFPQGAISYKAVYKGRPEDIILQTIDVAASLITDYLKK